MYFVSNEISSFSTKHVKIITNIQTLYINNRSLKANSYFFPCPNASVNSYRTVYGVIAELGPQLQSVLILSKLKPKDIPDYVLEITDVELV